ncbi:DUF2199 domain-containing protein [Kitasatospora saccharophila]|uniref:DUF2199 domain-containing protein n=1 Tax=Kitasatospora saccharophila TaxID=407973 RepID=A0ABP5ISH8_9ACTN
MANDPGWTCTCCGERHSELPMAYHAEAPASWEPGMAEREDCELTSDQCVVGEHSFVRGLVEIPVIGGDEVFAWGVWVSLSERNFARATELWERPGRESEPAYFGWLSTELPLYAPSTINLKTMHHTRPVGRRPYIELEPTSHPLAVEQRTGITLERVREIAEALLHPGRGGGVRGAGRPGGRWWRRRPES